MTIGDSGSIRALVTVSEQENYDFPEIAQGIVEPTNGVCFSGGGNRALSAATGQMRALCALGLLPSIQYVSCVSGGSWFSTPFTYYRSGPGSDEQFLGAVVSDGDRDRWSFEDWGYGDPFYIGTAATQSILDEVKKGVEKGLHAHTLWQNAVGSVYFEPFGLYDSTSYRFFNLSAASVGEVLSNNRQTQPGWSAQDFDTARVGRPYLIVKGTLIWPTGDLDRLNKVLMEFTPLYIGNPFLLSISDPRNTSSTREIGGGFVESFAFQSTGPTSPPPITPPGFGCRRDAGRGRALSHLAGKRNQQCGFRSLFRTYRRARRPEPGGDLLARRPGRGVSEPHLPVRRRGQPGEFRGHGPAPTAGEEHRDLRQF